MPYTQVSSRQVVIRLEDWLAIVPLLLPRSFSLLLSLILEAIVRRARKMDFIIVEQLGLLLLLIKSLRLIKVRLSSLQVIQRESEGQFRYLTGIHYHTQKFYQMKPQEYLLREVKLAIILKTQLVLLILPFLFPLGFFSLRSSSLHFMSVLLVEQLEIQFVIQLVVH